MIDIFNIANSAPQDKSIDYLQQVFGMMNGVLTKPGQETGTTITLLGSMFQVFNTVMLAVAALVIVYVIVTSTLRTAHEGEVMGRQQSALWIPLRIVLGIAGLFPMGSGYCLFQVIMMWVVVQGIGAADSLWGTVVSYSQTLGSPYAKVTIPRSGASAMARDMFIALSCEATFAETSPTPDTSNATVDTSTTPPSTIVPYGKYYCSVNSGGDFCSKGNNGALSRSADTYSFGPNGACGTLKYCNLEKVCAGKNPNSNEASLACKVCDKQISNLETIIATDRIIAQRFVATDYSYRNFYYNNNPAPGNLGTVENGWITKYCSDKNIGNCCVGKPGCVSTSQTDIFPSPDSLASGDNKKNANSYAVQNLYWPYGMEDWVGKDNPNFLSTQIDFMTNSVNDVVGVYLALMAQNPAKLNDLLKKASVNGWLYAGAFYYVVGKTNSDNQAQAIPTMQVQLNGDLNTGSTYGTYRINNIAAKTLINVVAASQNTTVAEGGQAATAVVTQAGGLSQDKNLGDIFALIDELKRDLSEVFTNGVLPADTNPIFAAQGMGFALLILLEIFYPLLLLASIVLGLIGNINVIISPGVSVLDPIGPMATLVYMVLIPALYGLMGIMATYGGLLGVYVPLIPFMIFTASAITWFLQVLEMLVAGPLVALGVMMPGGHHEVMGRAEPALMMLLNIFLRPSLMIFGLMAGMLISTVLCNLIFFTFWQIFIPQAGQPGLAFLAWIFYLGAFVALVVSAINKSYAAIYLLPERVITWIGGHAAQGGEAEMASEAKHAIEGGARGMGTAAKGAAEAGHAAGKAGSERRAGLQKAEIETDKLKKENKGSGSDIEGK